MSPLALLGLGFLLGIRHATDPDHVVAVIAISSRTRRWLPAAALGAMWGLGHTLTLFGVGTLIILFNLTVPARVGLALEFAVALALIVVGALNLGHRHAAGTRDGEVQPPGSAAQGRGGGTHAEDALLRGTPGRPEAAVPAGRAFSVGVVHGLAGSAAVALLVLSLIPDPRWASLYLLIFALGTLIGMALVTAGVAIPLAHAARRWPRFEHGARLATGTLSIAFGLWLAWQIGVVDGLFGAIPRWTPH
ncbi:MAG: high-affinity nickel-transport family protein [Candidatus Eisenbacteria bacterium]